MDIGETKAFLNIDYRFRSGNSIPISKAWINKAEWDAFKDVLKQSLVCLILADVPICDIREGMRVISAAKNKIGRITNIRLETDGRVLDDEFDIEWNTGRLSTIHHFACTEIWLIPDTIKSDPLTGMIVDTTLCPEIDEVTLALLRISKQEESR